MLPKKNRVSRKEFPYILANGVRYHSPHLMLYVASSATNNKLTETKFSFSVSKKISKTAVERNKNRRRGYSVVSKFKNKIIPGFVCFFVYKKGSQSLSFKTIEKEIKDLLHSSLLLPPVLS